MMAELEERTLRLYCPPHRISFSATAATRILCANGAHVLGLNFPFEGFWEYCCDCLTFWPSDILQIGEAAARCPVCERLTARRYLCDRCQVVSLESDEPAPGKLYTLSAKGAVSPSCPGCARATSAAVQKHRCKELGISLTTPRPLCPFCNEATALPVEKILSVFNELYQEVNLLRAEQKQLSSSVEASIAKLDRSIGEHFDRLRKDLADLRQGAGATIPPFTGNVIEFPVIAENYLSRMQSSLVPVKYDYMKKMLLRVDDGEGLMFLVEDGGAPDNMYYVVPQCRRFQMKSDFMPYSDYFECANPSAGEIMIIQPATAYRASGGEGWMLHDKGVLKV